MTVLFVGLGSIGQRHLRNLLHTGPFDVVALRTRRNPLPDDLKNVPMVVVDSIDAAVAAAPDIAFLCAPPRAQANALGPLVDGTACHLFIEKPIAPSTKGLFDHAETLERQGRKSLVGYNLRFHPVVICVRALLDEGIAGRVCSARASVGQYLPDWHPAEDYRQGYSARRELGGGVLLDLIHEIDLLCSWFGQPDDVKAMAGTLSGLEIDTEDTAEVLLRFPSGTIGSVHVDYVARVPHRGGLIIGRDASISYDLMANRVDIHRPGAPVETRLFTDFVRNDMYAAEVATLMEGIRCDTTCTPSLRDGARVLDVVGRARKSAGLPE